MKALITGITGQDGAYLAQFLLDKGYEVCGLKRRLSTLNLWRLDALGITDNVHLIDGDMNDMSSLEKAIEISNPDEVYNLAAQSFVKSSFDTPASTFDVNAKGVIHLLEIIKGSDTRLYQASTSEMFGNVTGMQDENTPFSPRSPYAVAKVAAHHSVKLYRDAYGVKASCGILFNHESPLRGEEFVTQKIVMAVLDIHERKKDKLYLGNLDASRDWGHAKDYVEAMWLMLQNEPDDFVVATGRTHTVREFVDHAFRIKGMDYRDHVEIDPKFFRPLEVGHLCGDPSKIAALGWRPRTAFISLIHNMLLNNVRLAA